MDAVGELDALSALAQIKADNPEWCLPEVVDARADGRKELHAANLGHPLIHDERRVGNDVTVGPPGTLLLITGSNMSGKSTLLRSIGLNAVLAQAGGPVCALALRMPTADIETQHPGAGLARAGPVVFHGGAGAPERACSIAPGIPDEGRVVLYLLDEILQGTNTGERAIAVRGVARHLLDAGAIGVMTTHDLGLAGEEPLEHRGAAGPLHRARGRARRHDVRLPAAARPGDVAQRAAADAADRDGRE